jgi:hypothetical protein
VAGALVFDALHNDLLPLNLVLLFDLLLDPLEMKLFFITELILCFDLLPDTTLLFEYGKWIRLILVHYFAELGQRNHLPCLPVTKAPSNHRSSHILLGVMRRSNKSFHCFNFFVIDVDVSILPKGPIDLRLY